METIIICIVFLFLFFGLIGCVIPVIPGPIFSLMGLFIFHFFTSHSISLNLLMLTILVFLFTILDYWLQLYSVQKFGGGKKAIYGTFIGLLVGMFFFPPFGIILGPLIGALIGALIEKKNTYDSVKIALGSLLGFIFGTVLKISISVYMIYLVISILI